MRADRAEAADIIDLDFHKAFSFFSPFFFFFHLILHRRLKVNKSSIDSKILNWLQKKE